MTNEEKHGLLDLAMNLESQGVKISIDFSLNGVVTITIWSNSEECHIDLQKMIHSERSMHEQIKCIEAFLKERESMKSKYEVVV